MAKSKRRKKQPMTPRRILTYCGIAAFVLTLLGGAGFTIMWPGQARSNSIEAVHEADKNVQQEIDGAQEKRIEKIEEHHKQISEDLGGLKEGQKLILERMANNR